MARYRNLIAQNIAPLSAKRIGVYNADGKRVGGFSLGNLQKMRPGTKQYSFGALSDVHIPYDTATSDFQVALSYLNDVEKVDFTCICGDLTSDGAEWQMVQYCTLVDTYSPDTPVYPIAGNHEWWAGQSMDAIAEQMGHPLWYSFTKGNDVFIMVSVCSPGDATYFPDSPEPLFTVEQMQWLYETLEANRNRRCFLFQHVRPDDACGNAHGIYSADIWREKYAVIQVFESLLQHYPNVIFFHGHSHLRFGLQTKSNKANYDNVFGCHSVHIPSLTVPRTGDVTGANSRQELYAESEGYVVDVYPTGIHLRGRDFVRGEFLPIASYWLDTTLQPVEAGTFADSTGTIIT